MNINPAIAVKNIEADTAFLNTQTGYLYSLNEVGSLVWQGLESGTAKNDIVALLCDTYEVEPAQARESIDQLIRELIYNKIIDENL